MQDTFPEPKIEGQKKISEDNQGLIHKVCSKAQEKEVLIVNCILEHQKKTQIKHPNIVCYKDVKQVNSTYEIIMEKCDGSLHKLLKECQDKGDYVRVPMLMDFFQQIMQGYKYLQSLFPYFVHRDFTLDNFLYIKQNERYIIKISDFGVSKIKKKNEGKQKQKQDSDIKSQLTILSQNFTNQKELFMPKEIKERLQYDNRVDVYSLGTCLYFLSLGKIDREYKGNSRDLNNSIFNYSQIKNKFFGLVLRMCDVEAQNRPQWEELYQYLFELPQLYNPLNKKNNLEYCNFLDYFKTLCSIYPQNFNLSTCMLNQNDITSVSNQQTTMIEIDSKVYKLVYKFMPLFLDKKIVKKQFFILLLVFKHKVQSGFQKLYEEYNTSFKYLYRIQSLKYIINIITQTMNKMMIANTRQPMKECYLNLIYDYNKQLKIIKTIKFDDDQRKYFKRYIKQKLGNQK
ncbi:hypothetical protein pb186bvf_003018 [Paramecium bursaria]